MTPTSLPLLAITLGDPAGIGPEIVLKALRHAEIYARCRPLVLGDRRILDRAAAWLGGSAPAYEIVDGPAAGVYSQGTVALLDMANAAPDECPPGRIAAAAGRAAVEYVFRACDLALDGQVDAIVTAPLNKEAMNLAGFHYAGHTELLAERCHAERISMLLTGPKLRVVHVSTHVALDEAIRRVTSARVGQVIDLAYESCRALGIPEPRIASLG